MSSERFHNFIKGTRENTSSRYSYSGTPRRYGDASYTGITSCDPKGIELVIKGTNIDDAVGNRW